MAVRVTSSEVEMIGIRGGNQTGNQQHFQKGLSFSSQERALVLFLLSEHSYLKTVCEGGSYISRQISG